jgi:hypothetical protein
MSLLFNLSSTYIPSPIANFKSLTKLMQTSYSSSLKGVIKKYIQILT